MEAPRQAFLVLENSNMEGFKQGLAGLIQRFRKRVQRDFVEAESLIQHPAGMPRASMGAEARRLRSRRLPLCLLRRRGRLRREGVNDPRARIERRRIARRNRRVDYAGCAEAAGGATP